MSVDLHVLISLYLSCLSYAMSHFHILTYEGAHTLAVVRGGTRGRASDPQQHLLSKSLLIPDDKRGEERIKASTSCLSLSVFVAPV
jgi:hypothetical protein